MTTNSYPNAKTIRRHELSNGMIVLIYENPGSHTVVMEGGFWCGAYAEDRAHAGLANLTASCLMRGTSSRSFEQVYEELESVGASVGYSAGYQLTEFSADSLAEDFDLLLDIVTDTLRNPTFPAEQVQRLQMEFMTRIQMRENDTRSMAYLTFRDKLYPDHPYGRSTLGYKDSIPTITPADLAAFHKKFYAPDRAVITVVSGINADDILAKLEAKLGDWHNPEYVAMGEMVGINRPKTLTRTQVTMPDKTQSDIILGLPGPRRNAPDFIEARVANTILGVFGMMGRLGQKVRVEQGLAYYANSSLPSSLGPFPWRVSTGVSPDKVEQAIASIQTEIRRIQDEPVSLRELQDTQAYLTGSLPMSLETNSGLTSIIYDMEVMDLGLDYLDNYSTVINAVTQEKVQAAAQKYFSADEIAIVVAGPN